MIELREVDELTYDVFVNGENEKWGDIQYHNVYGWVFFAYDTYEWFSDMDLMALEVMINVKYVNDILNR